MEVDAGHAQRHRVQCVVERPQRGGEGVADARRPAAGDAVCLIQAEGDRGAPRDARVDFARARLSSSRVRAQQAGDRRRDLLMAAERVVVAGQQRRFQVHGLAGAPFVERPRPGHTRPRERHAGGARGDRLLEGRGFSTVLRVRPGFGAQVVGGVGVGLVAELDRFKPRAEDRARGAHLADGCLQGGVAEADRQQHPPAAALREHGELAQVIGVHDRRRPRRLGRLRVGPCDLRVG